MLETHQPAPQVAPYPLATASTYDRGRTLYEGDTVSIDGVKHRLAAPAPTRRARWGLTFGGRLCISILEKKENN